MSDKGSDDQKELVEWFRLFDQVRRWVESVLKVMLSADPMRFVDGLQDGIVLCYLSRAIDERSIPRIQENNGSSLCIRNNITFFLGACKDFGLAPNSIFSPSDLASKKVVRVVETLAALARRVVLPPPDGVEFAVALPECDDRMDIESITALCPKESVDSVTKELASRRPHVRRSGGKPSSRVARAQIKLITGQGSCLFLCFFFCPRVCLCVSLEQCFLVGIQSRRSRRV